MSVYSQIIRVVHVTACIFEGNLYLALNFDMNHFFGLKVFIYRIKGVSS